jgi:hypothetical protein
LFSINKEIIEKIAKGARKYRQRARAREEVDQSVLIFAHLPARESLRYQMMKMERRQMIA